MSCVLFEKFMYLSRLNYRQGLRFLQRNTRRTTNLKRRYCTYPEIPDVCKVTGVEKGREFSEQKLLGYTAEEVYNVVADIDRYKDFLPWCKDSQILKERPGQCIARLSVGFPPLVESYTSLVILKPHTLVRSIATDGTLFSHLETTWKFKPGPLYPTGPSTHVLISTFFEFRSILYASVGVPIFDEVARKLASAFETRCKDLYGPDHLKDSKSCHATIRTSEFNIN